MLGRSGGTALRNTTLAKAFVIVLGIVTVGALNGDGGTSAAANVDAGTTAGTEDCIPTPVGCIGGSCLPHCEAFARW